MLPLALNDGADPDQAQRALQKLLVDTNVRAVVGPLWPALAAAAPAPLTTAGIPWFLPYDPFGRSAAATGAEPQWATGLVRAVANAVQGQGATALVLAGSAVGWPTLSAADWSRIAGLPVRFAAAPETVGANDAVFWLGSPADAAAYLTTLRTHQREVPFWLGPQGSDPVFTEHAPTFDRVYWVIWTDARYNALGSSAHAIDAICLSRLPCHRSRGACCHRADRFKRGGRALVCPGLCAWGGRCEQTIHSSLTTTSGPGFVWM